MSWPVGALAAVAVALLIVLGTVTLRARPSARRLLKDIEDRERALSAHEQQCVVHENAITASLQEAQRELERAAGMTTEEALQQLEGRLTSQLGQRIHEHARIAEADARATMEERARAMLGSALARVASIPSALRLTTMLTIPADLPNVKSRIIGPRGVNIRAFERVTGVGLTLEEPLDVLVLTHTDPWRRHRAFRTMQTLLETGRISLEKIEATYHQVVADEPTELLRAGREAAERAQVEGLDDVLLGRLGRLQFHQARGSDMLQRSVLGANIADSLARELGVDAEEVRLAALVRDIGYTEALETDGDHATAGAFLAEQAGLNERVCAAIKDHHRPPPFLEPVDPATALVALADFLVSTAFVENAPSDELITRMRRLEKLCEDAPGVAQAVSIIAANAVRVFVRPHDVAERDVPVLASRLAERLASEVQHGVTVTVLRETATTARAAIGEAATILHEPGEA